MYRNVNSVLFFCLFFLLLLDVLTWSHDRTNSPGVNGEKVWCKGAELTLRSSYLIHTKYNLQFCDIPNCLATVYKANATLWDVMLHTHKKKSFLKCVYPKWTFLEFWNLSILWFDTKSWSISAKKNKYPNLFSDFFFLSDNFRNMSKETIFIFRP